MYQKIYDLYPESKKEERIEFYSSLAEKFIKQEKWSDVCEALQKTLELLNNVHSSCGSDP